MPINPNAIGAKTAPQPFEWTDRETLLYALGVGAGTKDLAFTTENSHDIDAAGAADLRRDRLPGVGCGRRGRHRSTGPCCCTARQQIRLHAPLPPSGKLNVVSEVADIQDKGEGKNAILVLKGTGTDPETGEVVAESVSTAVIRGEGGFGGQPGERPVAPAIPDREPDAKVALPTTEDQPLIYRLSGDRNPLHSDPWFAQNLAGFPKPILHGLCTYGVAGRVLVAELGGGDATKIRAVGARFTSPVFPGETLTTSVWRTEPGHAVFRTEAPRPTGRTRGWCSTTAPPSTSTERVSHHR